MRFALTLAALSGMGALPAFSQPAPVLNILRESIKEGRTAAHEKVEADYAAAFRKGNLPERYVALATMSGPGEVWFIQPMPSFAAQDEYDKASGTEPLKSALAMLEARDGELRQSSRSLWAVYGPSEAKPYCAGFAKGNVDGVILGYQVVAGAPARSEAAKKTGQ